MLYIGVLWVGFYRLYREIEQLKNSPIVRGLVDPCTQTHTHTHTHTNSTCQERTTSSWAGARRTGANMIHAAWCNPSGSGGYEGPSLLSGLFGCRVHSQDATSYDMGLPNEGWATGGWAKR